ncbi:electron transfer protein with DM13 domain protein [Synechococcus sp. RSCCF101]|uniref:DM13 domain-containing protein n=1 Tax=Synechococcus sp. RSCCF101 TaxID=2511069 RepID=UPI0012440B80|nr:DM13 domain-containing protein [Synechococcus sp. RSCCF101]QEY32683.1 electron transfer protein with DM13 domain protein [Synechococcus sp. RSCCF101]
MAAQRSLQRSLLAPAATAAAGLSLAATLTLGCTAQESSPPAADAPTAEQTAPPTPPAGTAATREGAFVSGEHPTSGTARLLQENGDAVLTFDEAFSTSSSGPDLVVVLHRSEDVIGSTVPPAFPINDGDVVVVAPLKRTTGEQSYTLPADLNPDDFPSVAVWCRRFNATFGAARLQP